MAESDRSALNPAVAENLVRAGQSLFAQILFCAEGHNFSVVVVPSDYVGLAG